MAYIITANKFIPVLGQEGLGDVKKFIKSFPPNNMFRVINIWINSENGKLIIEYDDND